MRLSRRGFFTGIFLLLGIIFWTLNAIRPAHGAGFYNLGMLRSKSQSKLKITTGAQSIDTQSCSGVVTIETDNAANVATNVSSNLTVNLTAASNLTYYSDSSCTSAITTTTVTSGTHLKSIYFASGIIGSYPFAATATGYSSVNQTETVTAFAFTWMGGGGNTAWSTAGNWAGGAAPGSGNMAVFDANCSSNCSPTTTAAVSIQGIKILSGYTGTITQGAFTFTVGTSGWIQSGGTFLGNNAGTAMSVTNSFTVSGGSFTSTSGTLTIVSTAGIVLSVTGSAFTANGGILAFSSGWVASSSITPGTSTYNNVTFNSNNVTTTLNSGTMKVGGSLTFSDGGYGDTFNSGTFSVSGNVTGNTTGPVLGSALVSMAGSAGGQTVNAGAYPKLAIVAGANNVTLSGTITVGAYSVTSVGTLTTTGSTLVINLAFNSGTISIPFGSATYNNITLKANQATYDLGGSTVNISGNLLLYALNYGMTVNNGTLAVAGNVTTNTTAGAIGGTAAVTMNGAASTTVTITAGSYPTGNVVVNKTGGTYITLATNVSWNNVGQSTSVTSGSISMAGFNLTLKSLTLSAGTSITRTGGTLTVNGSVIGAGAYSGGTIN